MFSPQAENFSAPALTVFLAAKALTTAKARQQAFSFRINLFKEQISAAKLATTRLLDKKEPKAIKEEESLASTIYYAGKAPLAFAVLRNAHLLSGYAEYLLVQTLLENNRSKAAQILLKSGFLSDRASIIAVKASIMQENSISSP